MILIVDDPEDVHTRCVRKELTAMNVESAVLDTAEFGKSARLGITGRDAAVFTCSDTGARHRVGDVSTTWLRRPGRFDLSQAVRQEYLGFATHEWRDMFWGLIDSMTCRFINPLVHQERATKILQLQAAHAAGLNTPDTLVSNDADAVRRFVERHKGQVIHKSLTQAKSMLFDTKKWTEDETRHLDQLHLAPIMVQELIGGVLDVRATVIGDRIYAAIMESPPDIIDSRLVTDLPYETYALSPELSAQIMAMMKRLGLVYGAVDLKLAHDGTPYFLEVNPQGQFAYIEIATGMPLIREFAQFLAATENS